MPTHFDPYSPIYSNNYEGKILDAHHNTVQGAFDLLENHDHLAIVTSSPTGEILGKSFALDTSTATLYVWDGSSWYPISGSAPVYSDILLESGSYFLLENGFKLILG